MPIRRQRLCGSYGHNNRKGKPCGHKTVIGAKACRQHGGGPSGKTQEYANETSGDSHRWKRLKLTRGEETRFDKDGGYDGLQEDLVKKLTVEARRLLGQIAHSKTPEQLISYTLGLADRLARLDRITAMTKLINNRADLIRPPADTPAGQISKLTELREDQEHGLAAEEADDNTD